jgi:sigma-B regulation protein RsbU (phosphoserine phosphatase)
MWQIESTIQLLKEMSRSTEPGELIRLFFDYIRQSFDVRRAVVLSSSGLSAPQYRLVHDVNWSDGSNAPVVTLDELRQGGSLAEFLYLGEFQNIAPFVPATSDPAFGLLQGSGSLMAFPIFERGSSTGMVVMLGSSPQPRNPADVCALATMTSLLGRAIEARKLASQLEQANRALESELKAAADVQRWLLPSLPTLDKVGIAASYRTARYSGGDYYDVGVLPDGKLGVFIADVSGKGAAAAVLMAVLRSIVHDEIDRTRLCDPAVLLDHAHSRLRALGLPERGAFVTAFCGVLNPATGALVYSCAGHNPPRLLRVANRTVISLDGASTFPLGLLSESSTHTLETVVLGPTDLVLFYTDGITEARAPDREFFGTQRLDEILCGLSDPITPDSAIQAITRAVDSFVGNALQDDDQTLLALGGCRP